MRTRLPGTPVDRCIEFCSPAWAGPTRAGSEAFKTAPADAEPEKRQPVGEFADVDVLAELEGHETGAAGQAGHDVGPGGLTRRICGRVETVHEEGRGCWCCRIRGRSVRDRGSAARPRRAQVWRPAAAGSGRGCGRYARWTRSRRPPRCRNGRRCISRRNGRRCTMPLSSGRWKTGVAQELSITVSAPWRLAWAAALGQVHRLEDYRIGALEIGHRDAAQQGRGRPRKPPPGDSRRRYRTGAASARTGGRRRDRRLDAGDAVAGSAETPERSTRWPCRSETDRRRAALGARHHAFERRHGRVLDAGVERAVRAPPGHPVLEVLVAVEGEERTLEDRRHDRSRSPPKGSASRVSSAGSDG